MSNVGFATLSVIPSFQGFQSRLSAGVAAPMTSAGRTGGKKFGDAAGREAGDRFRSGFSERLKGFAPLAGLALGAGAVAFLKDAVDGASDLSESGNKINAVFGDAQAQIQDFASDASDSLGQTKLQALDAASTFGTFGKAAGLTGDALAGFSTELVSLSTDMASFYNTDVSTAIEAIGSGLRGEAEPLRQFGVLLDDATLRAEAMKQGLISSTKEALTPQQKVLAAHAVIMKQTADAQGDFQRTSDGLANKQRILTAQWEEMKATVGAELLPAVTGFVTFLSDDAIPAIGDAGGVVKDVASAFGDLPAPVKAAAAAFVALRIASAAGLTAGVVTSAGTARSAIDSLRLRTMMAADAYREARTTTMAFNGNIGTVSQGVGRLSASMEGLRAGATGAGTALKRGLGGAMSILGGPWGVALAAGTVAVAHFWSENQEAKRRVEELTDSLDKQTGALTNNSHELVYNALQKAGAVEAARTLGINLNDLQRAAEGDYAAMQTLTRQLDFYQAAAALATGNPAAFDKNREAAAKLRTVLGDQNGDLAQSKQDWRDHAEAMGESVTATNETKGANDKAAGSFRSLADRIADARTEIQRLANAENARRLARVQAKRDELALIETAKAAQKEARDGKKTLDENTKAGRENWSALLDLADQWNNSKAKVRNAQGAYSDMRKTFVDVAIQMGASRDRAQELADKFIKLPKHKKIDITTPGMEQAKEDLEDLRERLKSVRELAIYVNTHQQGNTRQLGKAYATGGYVSGPGTGTSDSIFARLSNGEFVQRSAAVDYYGVEFMRRLNALQVPKLPGYAAGGLVESRASSAAAGVNVQIGQVVAHDYADFMRQTQRRVRAASGGGVTF